jgi:CxxC motif-containing protein (DUF1111 family)
MVKSFTNLTEHSFARSVLVGCIALVCSSAAASFAEDPFTPNITNSSVGFGNPIPGLTQAELIRFGAGKVAFEEVEGVADGIGPVFNRNSCVACHDNQATGGSSNIFSVRIGKVIHGRFDPLLRFGGPTIQTEGIVGLDGFVFPGEIVPPEANIVAKRRTPTAFGFGLVDAVPGWYLILNGLSQAIRTPATAGHPNIVSNLRTGNFAVGKFGWKCGIATLFDFAGDAYKDEMGITTPGWVRSDDGRSITEENPPQGKIALLKYNPGNAPNEEDVEDIVLFNDFMSFLAPPPRGPINRLVRRGEVVFSNIGCADCNTSTLITGLHESPALSFKIFHPYSDFLLHDMGTLGDGIEQGIGSATEMRTAPLWGLRVQTAFLHDGRASTVEEAIVQHAGQGRFSRSKFLKLSQQERAELLAFLNSL